MITKIQPYSFKKNYFKPTQHINQISFGEKLPTAEISKDNMLLFKKVSNFIKNLSKNKTERHLINGNNEMYIIPGENRLFVGLVDTKNRKTVQISKTYNLKPSRIKVWVCDDNVINLYSQKTRLGINESLVIKDDKNNLGKIYKYKNEYGWLDPSRDSETDMMGEGMAPKLVEQFNDHLKWYISEITNRIDEFKKLARI